MHLPDEMHMIGHYDKGIEFNPPIVDQETKAIDNYIFVFIRLQQLFPFKVW
jgi:hypothetical protein